MRAACGLLLAAALCACGGSATKKDDTTVSNQSGAVVAPTPTEGRGELPGDARVIQRTQSGGVIELVGARTMAMQRATDEMLSHCGHDNFTIVQEGEEAVAAPDGGPRTDTAWRVHYQCNGSQASP